MKPWWICAVVALALGAAGCASSSDPAPAAAGLSEEAPLRLIANLGSDAVATDALIIAMDSGYSGPQILSAVDDDRLRRDGTIDGEEPELPALGLVLYDLAGEGEGASGSRANGARGAAGQVMLVAFFQVEQTPIERLRQSATVQGGVGDPAVELILLRLAFGFTPQDIIETLILGVDEPVDHPSDLEKDVTCLRVADELYCPGGERFPASVLNEQEQPEQPDSNAEEVAPEPPATEDGAGSSEPMRLRWEGEMTPDPKWVKDPVLGTYVLTRTEGTNNFQVTFTTTDAKSGTFTTDGFNSVVCTSEWTSVFEGTGTFWDHDDLGIEFDGEITRSIVYTSGPCDADLDAETSPFTGVLVRVTDKGIESSFNAWSFDDGGPPPMPVGS